MCSGLLNVTFGVPVISRKLINNFPEVLTSADMTNPICPIGFACVSGTIHSINFTSLFESSYSAASIWEKMYQHRQHLNALLTN